VEVAKVVRTRTAAQVCSHAQHFYFKQLEREGKADLIPPKGKPGPQPKVRTEEAHQQQQEPTLSSASTSSGTICTTGDHDDDSTGGVESTPPASIFEEETNGGSSVDKLCEDAAAASDTIKRELYEDLVYIESAPTTATYQY